MGFRENVRMNGMSGGGMCVLAVHAILARFLDEFPKNGAIW